jgi:cob(I)alamin adenosyltransferase
MVKLNKIYTKTGDKGSTSLASGKRVSKDHYRIKAYGTVDELNSILGIVRVKASSKVKKIISDIQNDLFDLGADLATPEQKKYKFAPLRITENQVNRIEKSIDQYNKKLGTLNSFILPGGSESASFLHNARTVARRAETQTVALSKKEKINKEALRYINRLSDLLFVLSRVENNNGKKDILWKPGKNS